MKQHQYHGALLDAVQEGDVKLVKQYIIQDGVPLQPPSGQTSALHAAVTIGHTELALWLLDQGAVVDAVDEGGWTPLHWAAQENRVEIARELVEHRGAQVDALNDSQWTPLSLCCERGHLDVAQLLLERGAATDGHLSWPPLLLAAERGHTGVVLELLKHGPNVNTVDDEGRSALHLSAFYGYTEIFTALVNHGAEVDLRTARLETPLHLATRAGHLELAVQLLQLGADTSSANVSRLTPMHHASRQGNAAVVGALIKAHADINCRSLSGETPLLLAATFGHSMIVRRLLQHGADVEASTDELDRPLHRACESGHQPAAEELVSYGADVHSQDGKKMTPLQRSKWARVAAVCAARGADATHPRYSGDENNRPAWSDSENTMLCALTRRYHAWAGVAVVIGCLRGTKDNAVFANMAYDIPSCVLPYLMDKREPAVKEESAARSLKLRRRYWERLCGVVQLGCL